MINKDNLEVRFDERKQKYGVAIHSYDEEKRTKWWVKPQFDAIGSIETRFGRCLAWVKVGKNYGTIDLDARQIIIEPQYGCVPCWTVNLLEEGQTPTDEDIVAIVWKDHKAGVINLKGEVIMPFIYDSLIRIDGKIQEEQRDPIVWNIAENEHRTVEELTQKVIEEWKKLRAMGYSSHVPSGNYDSELQEKFDQQKEIIKAYLLDRRQAANLTWEHSVENATRLSRTNDLLMQAVSRAMKMGKKTAQSLTCLDEEPDSYCNDLTVYVYPQSAGSFDEDIMNIIIQMGQGADEIEGITPCFMHRNNVSEDRDIDTDWDLKTAIMDDGKSWDEGLHYPAYQDVYFTQPWHQLFFEAYTFSLEDLAQMEDFRVDMRLHTEVEESIWKDEQNETLQGFYRKCDFEKMVPLLEKLQPSMRGSNMLAFRMAFDEICALRPWTKKKREKEQMSRLVAYPSFREKEEREQHPTPVWAMFLEGTIWREALGRRFYLPDKRLRKLPREEIGAAMLWHQTFYQFTTLKDRQLMRPFPKPTNIQEPKREDDQWLREWFYDEERENYDWSLESGHTEEEDDAECAREEQFERERLALLIEKAEKEKDPEIQFRLGKYYQAKEKDELYLEAAKWLQLAVEQGNAKAMNNLGTLYDEGHGVERNHDKARELWLRSIELIADGVTYGRPEYNLGVMAAWHYDYEEAAKWLLRALDKGFWCYEELYYVHQKLGIELEKK